MNEQLQHGIHIFIVKFMQEKYHSASVTFLYLTLGDKDMDKSA